MKFNETAQAGSFKARDNVSNFIKWARGLGIDSAVIFESDDLVENKNEKNVLYWFALTCKHGLIAT